MQNVSTFTPQPGQTTVGEMRQPKIHQMVPRAGAAVRERDRGRQEGMQEGRNKGRRRHAGSTNTTDTIHVDYSRVRMRARTMNNDGTSRHDMLGIR